MSKGTTRSYELVVIGGGPAGTSGAVAAGLFGHRVALVEKAATIDGAGLNSGTVPSKTLRETTSGCLPATRRDRAMCCWH